MIKFFHDKNKVITLKERVPNSVEFAIHSIAPNSS